MKKKTQSNLSPSDLSTDPFSKGRRTIERVSCIFYNFVRSWKYSLTSIKCRHFLMSSRILNIFKMADSFIRITFDSSKATTASLRPSSPKRISVCPKMRRMPNCFFMLSSEVHEKLPSRTTQIQRYLPSLIYLEYMDVAQGMMMASCAIQRLMKCSELVSKNLLKKGRRESDLAISIPQKGILSCYYFDSTLKICCSSPFTSRLNSSIVFYYTSRTPSIEQFFPILRRYMPNTIDGLKFSDLRQQLVNKQVAMRIRMYCGLGLVGTMVVYPVVYWGWVKQMKNSWLENDILQNHLDILYPETGRYSKTAATHPLDQQYEEVLVFTSKKSQAGTK